MKNKLLLSILSFMLIFTILYKPSLPNVQGSSSFIREEKFMKIVYPNTSITAHRGYAVKSKENTMKAFKKAVENGAKWIEVDVRKSKNGVLVINHDESLKRVFKANTSVSRSSFLTLQEYNIPSLEEVIVFAKENNIHINVELKQSGIEKAVVNLINKYDYIDNIAITSFNYSSLKKVEEINPEIKTLLLAYNAKNILSKNKVDGYSIRYQAVSSKDVKAIHDANKLIYVWTVNSEAAIKKMLKMEVDNIITDKILLALKLQSQMTFIEFL